MKKLMYIIVILLLFSGCSPIFFPLPTEIDHLELVRIIALDKSDKNPDEVIITIMFEKTTSDSSSGGRTGSGETDGGETKGLKGTVLTAEGKTFSSAERNFQTYTDKQIFLGHADFCLIGEEAAKEDITKYLDFISRDHDVRKSSKVYIVAGKASDLVVKANSEEYFLPDRLKSMSQNVKFLSVSRSINLFDCMSNLDKKNSSLVVPTLKLIERKEDILEESKQRKQDIELVGYSIINHFKLVSFIERPISRGYNIISNSGVSGIIDVKDSSGMAVALEINTVNTKITPKIEGGQLVGVLIITELNTSINEIQSRENVFKKDILSFLEQQASDIIKSEMEAVVKAAQQNNADILSLSESVNMNHPIIWNRIKDNWDSIFPTLKIEVIVNSKIARTYDMREPSGSMEGEHG